MYVVFRDAPNKCALIHPKQERVETNGDGVELLASVNVQMRTLSCAFEHFCPVPVCFGVIREFMQRSFGGFGVLKRGIGCTSLTWECCSPSFPSGFPPPLVKSAVLLKCGICFSSFLIKFESRIKIIERRTE